MTEKTADGGGLEEVDEDLLPDGHGDPTLTDTVVGAWKEALAAEGADRFALVMLVFTLTVFIPALFILMLLSWIGVIA